MKYKLTIESDDAAELAALLGGNHTLNMSLDIRDISDLVSTEIDKIQTPTAPVAQMPASAPAAPAAPETPAPSAHAATGGDTDNTGLPWDERIHASSKALNADGTWRKKRGVDDDTYNAIVGILRDDVAAAPAAPETPAVPQMPTSAPETPAPAQPAAPAAPQAPAAPVAPAQPAAPAAPQAPAELPKTFDGFMQLVQVGLQTSDGDGNPVITPQYLQELIGKINAAYEAHGIKLASITDLNQHPYMVEWVCQLMQNDGRAVLA